MRQLFAAFATLFLALAPKVCRVMGSVPEATVDLWVSTPSDPRACHQTSIKFCGGTPPYRLQLIEGSNYDEVLGIIATGLQGAGSFQWV